MNKLIHYLKTQKLTIVSLAFSFTAVVATYAYLFYAGDLSVWIKNLYGADLLWLPIGVGFYAILKKGLAVNATEKGYGVWIIGILFASIILIGHSLTINGNLEMYVTTAGLFLFVTSSIGFASIFGALILLTLDYFDKHPIKNLEQSSLYQNATRTFFIIWGIILLVYFLYFLFLYPGVLTYDSTIEINQVAAGEYSDHHPFIHVMMVAFFINLSKSIGGSLETAIAMYSVVQMIIISGIFAYAVTTMVKLGIKKWVVILLVLFYALPFHAVFSLTVWKDILFSGICLLAVIWLVKLYYNDELIKDRRFLLSFAVILTVFGLLRHNGYYALLLFFPILLIVNRFHYKYYLVLIFTVIGIVSISSKIILPALGVKKGGMQEMLSVPLQQLARTVKYHDDELSKDDKLSIREILVTDSLAHLYQPHISDPVKSTFNEEAFKAKPSKYLKLWTSLFTRYPKTFIETFLEGSYGYYDPNVNYGSGYFTSTASQFKNDLEWTLNNTAKPSVSKKDAILNVPKQMFLHTPVLSLITSIGFYLWVAVILVFRCIVRKNYRLLLPLILLGCLYLTLLASPVYADFRYSYGIIISIPFLFFIVWLETKSEVISKKKVPRSNIVG